MRRQRKPYALQLRDELLKNTNGAAGNGKAAPAPVPATMAAPPKQKIDSIKPANGGLGSLVVATQKKVEAELPPLTFEETFRGRQSTLNDILRVLIYENEVADLVKKGQMTPDSFAQLKAAAAQAYKAWPKEIYAEMLKYQKARYPNGTK